MLNNEHAKLSLEGAVVAGQRLRACDEDSVYAVYRRPNCSCGAVVELGARQPFIRFSPGVQIPPAARAGFERFVFEHDDDDMVDLDIDKKDGEVTLQRPIYTVTAEEAERLIAPTVDWVNDVAYPAIMAYIASVYQTDED